MISCLVKSRRVALTQKKKRKEKESGICAYRRGWLKKKIVEYIYLGFTFKFREKDSLFPSPILKKKKRFQRKRKNKNGGREGSGETCLCSKVQGWNFTGPN
jgi:hypothetical protein